MEKDLRARLRAGDPEAFRELFDDHARSVYNYAYRLTGDWQVAEDVVSLTFLEAWRLRERLDSEGTLRVWLLGVATNVARNVRRANRRHAGVLARVPPPPDVADFADATAARLDDRDRLAAVRAAISRLRPAEREVLVLCAWEGLDYAAAARALDIPIGTVRSRLARARATLARLTADGRADPRPSVVQENPS